MGPRSAAPPFRAPSGADLDRLYNDFSPPPLAKTYYPTAEEFDDPIAYVAKIKPEAEKYGVVKIVPPTSFKPPFAINKKTFEFTPRVQRLNEVEAIWRERTTFIERLRNFWELQGQQFRIPFMDGKYVDLYKAHSVILEEGGFDEVTKHKRWMYVAKCLGVRSQQGGSKLKDQYRRFILPFLDSFKDGADSDDCSDEEIAEKKREDGTKKEEGGDEEKRGLGEGRSTMQGGSRTHRATRAGVRSAAAKREAPNGTISCEKCSRDDRKDSLLTCQDCSRIVHFGCLSPPLTHHPKGEWRCRKCLASEVRKVGMGFGFYDAESSYTLETFSKFADDFKREYFGMEPKEVPIELVEKTFWQKVNDMNETVAVKYGADLITSRVGSGFARRTDLNSREKEVREYANHPWNLNNLPVLRDSVLTHFDAGISGMMVPWVYVGMCFSTFCWHTEDHWTYSINYNHWGETKVWYGVSGDEAPAFEEAVRGMAPGLFVHQPDLLHHMTTAVNPQLLRSRGVSVYSVRQKAGEFVITFPRAYHAGFNEGLNFAEAVNFAPIDWLRLGRACMSAYAVVRRGCVFSHDELVLKMVAACDKLSVSSAVAALDELKQMSLRESRLRGNCAEGGVTRAERVEFDKIPDDARVCRECNTTLFMSALSCHHGRVVCLEHTHAICSKCPLDECLLQYRYTLEELPPMLENLRKRTNAYEEWLLATKNALDQKKPSAADLQSLVDAARRSHFPHSPTLKKAVQLLQESSSVLTACYTLVNDRVRVRSTTRSQRADNRPTVETVQSMLEELHSLPVDASPLSQKIQEVLRNAEKWSQEALSASSGEDSSAIRSLIDNSHSINVKLDLSELFRAQERVEWAGKIEDLLAWQPEIGIETKEDFISRSRWQLSEVKSLLEEGERCGARESQRMEELSRIYANALEDSSLAGETLSLGNELNESLLVSVWQRVIRSDWCISPGLDELRGELQRVQEVRIFEEEGSSELTRADILEAIDNCEKSLALRNNSPRLQRVTKLLGEMETFTRSINNLFRLPHSYYSLLQILKPREDLVMLAEGQKVPLKQDKTELDDVWGEIEEFSSRADLDAHFGRLWSQQPALFTVLRTANSARPIRATCLCQKERRESDCMQCLLCNGRFHLACAWWSPPLARLPPGAFLCVRCLRSGRPLLEEVDAVLSRAPRKSLEVQLVAALADSARQLAVDTIAAAEEWQKDPTANDERLRGAVLATLGCECQDEKVLNLLNSLIPELWPERVKADEEAWQRIRSISLASKHIFPDIIFSPHKRRGKALTLGTASARKKPRRGETEEDTPCDIDECIQPYCDTLTWIQCGECSRWLHIICTGEVIDPSLPDYVCAKCRGSSTPLTATQPLVLSPPSTSA